MSAERRIYREALRVGERASFSMTGPVVHVASRDAEVVEFWRINDPSLPCFVRTFEVVGTGHLLPDGGYIGTAVTPGGQFVWHLIEVADA